MAEEKSIDASITNVEKQIDEHRKEAKKILIYVIVASIMVLSASYSVYWNQSFRVYAALQDVSNEVNKFANSSDSTSIQPLVTQLSQAVSMAREPIDTSLVYVFIAVFVVVFGVMMAIYRFHLTEISRSQQYRLGLMRIRVAANNADNTGFGSEVRQSLTFDAFHYSSGSEKKVDSPLPGHPASDVGAMFVNKVLDKFDIEVKTKNTRT